VSFPTSASSSNGRGTARAPTVLLVEDEEIVALEIAETLIAAGFGVAGPFGTKAATTAWLAGGMPYAAIFDVQLRDGDCLESLMLLREAGVPVAICTAGRLPAELSSLPVFEKPMDPRCLVRFLNVACRKGAG
jgi:DNA-binding response OmpR family regulator